MRRIFGDPGFLPQSFVIDAENGDSAPRMFAIVGATTAFWLLATFLTRPSTAAALDAFYRRVKPGGAWGPVSQRCSDVVVRARLGRSFVAWIVSTILVLACLFAIGEMLFGGALAWLGWAATALVCAFVVLRLERRM